MRSTRPLRSQALRTVAVGSLLVALAVFVLLGYRLGWQWTGFPPKRLFDWIQILVIPVAVAIGTFVLNRAAKRRDDEAQARHAEEASLQAYLDYMSRLLTDPDRPLRRSQLGDNLSVVARAQTLTALGRLEDEGRKRTVLQFLYEAGLIERKRPIISLAAADAGGANLQGAYLRGAYLREAHLVGAKLGRASLVEADVVAADLQEAYLRGAYLMDADLRGAKLRRADLVGANLQGADLRGADLQKASLGEADLQGAHLSGAYLMDADLQEAHLVGADLQRASLEGADLGRADFQEADLGGARLQGANLQEADLRGANLEGAKGLAQPDIEKAIGDESTVLPQVLTTPTSWITRTDEQADGDE